MSAASVQPPMTTTYVQAPHRFHSPKQAGATQQQQQQHPTQRMHDSPLAHTQQRAGGTPQRVSTPQQHAQPQRGTPSPSRGPRVNPNFATSAGFPLAMTAAQKADIAQRKLEERMEWEERHYEAMGMTRADEEAAADALDAQRLQHEAAQSSAAAAAARSAQDALYKRQLRDPKIPFRERVVPPRPLHPEDPLTARASEHTGIFFSERVPTPLVPFTRDDEPAAPEGTPERAEQRRRTNPLLDPLYTAKSDAAGLGYGRTHRAHFRYISHWSTNESTNAALEMASSSMGAAAAAGGHMGAHAYRSKDGRPYDPSVRSLGWGAPHDAYNRYISVRRADDVLKDYPNREACEKFLHRKS